MNTREQLIADMAAFMAKGGAVLEIPANTETGVVREAYRTLRRKERGASFDYTEYSMRRAEGCNDLDAAIHAAAKGNRT